jgi:hypothetical protein
MSSLQNGTTEIAIFSLKSDVDIYTKGSDGEKAVQKMFSVLAEQPGYQGAHYGVQEEYTEKVTCAIGNFCLDSGILSLRLNNM